MGKLLDEFHRILIPIDFSESSRQALEACSKLFSGHEDKEFHFVYVHRTPSEYPGLEESPKPELEGDLRDFVAEYLAQNKPPEHAVVLGGHPATEICQYAAEVKCDLIVMPTHGRTGLSHMLLGSVAENVVRHATCPVLVLRTRETT